MAWTLSKIRQKVRDLSGTPDTNQKSDAAINEYIENFYLQDMVALLNLEEMDDYHRIRTIENVERYGNLPSNFDIKGPCWVNGRQVVFYRDESCFYREYPQNYQTRESIGSGDAATTNFTGTLNNQPVSPTNFVIDDDNEIFSPRALTINAITQATNAAVTCDQIHLLTTGDRVMVSLIQSGMLEINNKVSKITKTSNTEFTLDSVDSSNFTDYESGGVLTPLTTVPLEGNLGGTGTVVISTGVYDINFSEAPADGQDIRANYEVYSPGEPDAVLLDGRDLIVRPVPDGTYDIKIGVTKQPDLFTRDGGGNISDTNATLLRDDWGKMLAYGAAIDLLNDRNQQEIAQQLQAQFDQLMAQINARWIRNMEGQRSLPTF